MATHIENTAHENTAELTIRTTKESFMTEPFILNKEEKSKGTRYALWMKTYPSMLLLHDSPIYENDQTQ